MLSRERAWDVVLEDHEIDHWSIVAADVQKHARKRTISVVTVHTLIEVQLQVLFEHALCALKV